MNDPRPPDISPPVTSCWPYSRTPQPSWSTGNCSTTGTRRDGTFHGAIFIIAADGHQTHSLPWSAPTDIAADTALRLAEWVRTDNWVRDDSGRRVARVIFVAAETSPTVPPGQRTPTHDGGYARPATSV